MDYTLKGAPRLRRDTDANWKAVNPVLADGEQIAIKMTDGSIRYKIGNGSSDYNSLKYFVDQNYIDSKETICDTNSKKPISFSVGGIDGDNFVVEITGGGDSTSFVESFNGRSGDVVPQSGDYTASDVGAIAASEKGKASGVATLDSGGKVPTAQIPSLNYDVSGAASAVQTNLNAHANNTTTHITSDERTAWNAKAAKPTVRTLTLSTAGWDSDAKTQTVACSGVLADETAQLITPVPALASQTAYYEAGILCTGQAADSLTFTANTTPTVDLTVYVTIQAL